MLCRVALRAQMVEQRINSEVLIKALIEPIALVKGIREPHEVKTKIF